MTITKPEMLTLLDTVKSAVEEIAEKSGYGRVVIDCANGAPREIRVEKSLRFRRDVCNSPEVPIPE